MALHRSLHGSCTALKAPQTLCHSGTVYKFRAPCSCGHCNQCDQQVAWNPKSVTCRKSGGHFHFEPCFRYPASFTPWRSATVSQWYVQLFTNIGPCCITVWPAGTKLFVLSISAANLMPCCVAAAQHVGSVLLCSTEIASPAPCLRSCLLALLAYRVLYAWRELQGVSVSC